jgi:hypothetical protein
MIFSSAGDPAADDPAAAWDGKKAVNRIALATLRAEISLGKVCPTNMA